MNEKEFVCAVKRYKCIYSKGAVSYSKDKRALAWQELSQKFSTPTKILKTRWRSIRDRYVREHRQRISNTYVPPKNRMEWNLYKHLEFLNGYIIAKKIDKSIGGLHADNTEFANEDEDEEIGDILQENVSEDDSAAGCYCTTSIELDAQKLDTMFNDSQHDGFYQEVIQNLNQLPLDEQEDAKMYFLNYLHEMTKTSNICGK